MEQLLAIKGKGTTVEELLELDILDKALAVKALYLIKQAKTVIEESKEP